MRAFCYVVTLFLSLSTALAQNSYTVSEATDFGSPVAQGTLSWAIDQANTDNTESLITFSVDKVTLTAVLPDITQSCTIIGQSPLVPATASGGTTIERNASEKFRIFKATQAPTHLVLLDLILQNGVVEADRTDGDSRIGGGGLLANLGATGGLIMTRCLIRNCSTINSTGNGGGVQLLSGTAIITDCQFANNSSRHFGGGFVIGEPTSANTRSALLQRCTFVGNSAQDEGGGFYQRIPGDTPTSLINCTFSANSAAGTGNAIHNYAGNLAVVHSSFVGNSGAYHTISYLSSNFAIQLVNCLFSGNVNSNGIGNFPPSTVVQSLGGNVSSDAGDGSVLNQSSDKVGLNLLIGPLQQNTGGLVSTFGIENCSPARDAGITSTTVSLPGTDANNQSRVGLPDAGAYEFQGIPILLSVSLSSSNSGTLTCNDPSLTLIATASGGNNYTYAFAGPGLSTTTTSTTATVSQAGTFSVTAQIAEGCTASTTIAVSGSGTPVGTININAVGAIGCGPNNVTLTASSTGAESYTQLPGGKTNSNGAFVVTTVGNYTIVASNGFAGCQSQTTVTVGQGTNAVAGSITTSGPASCGSPARFTAPATGSSFVFTGPGGYVFSNANRNPGSYTAFAEGVKLGGTYTLTVYGSPGCPTATSRVEVQGPTTCP